MTKNKMHWQNIYLNKNSDELSWTEEIPETSLSLIQEFRLSKKASIIDIGGGESRLADFLLDAGYINITVLDISENGIEKAKKRLGSRADKITWIVQDVADFTSAQTFDCWHDRAAFHFMTDPEQIANYVSLITRYIKSEGFAVIGTFSETGPEKCSGLHVQRYNQESLTLTFSNIFRKLKCLSHVHDTPFKTKQDFLYCCFQKI